MKTPHFFFSSLLATFALVSGALAQSPAARRPAPAAVPAPVLSPIIVASAGPTSPLYLTDGTEGMNWVIQGHSVINSWPQQHFEYAIAVANTVRTIGVGLSSLGSEYTLNGVYTGVDFTSPATGLFYDGASGGNLIYSANYIDGGIYSFNADWTDPTLLFSTPADYLAIAFDSTNNSLWIASFDNSTVENRSLTGTLLSSFTVPFTEVTCLALDPADNTLWMGSKTTEGTFYQYTKSGLSLGSVTYSELVGKNTLGAEFSVNAERQGHVFGQGTIASPFGGQASFMIDVRNDNKKGRITGRVAFSDPAKNFAINTGQITYLVINGRTAGISGSGIDRRDKRKRFSFTIHVSDNGPGSTDTFSIAITNGYGAHGTLTSGDITID